MKVCPFCEAELRDSVIKCTRCGRSLAAASDEALEPAPAGAGLGAPATSMGTRGANVGFPTPEAPGRTSVERPAPSRSWTPPPVSRPEAIVPSDLASRRALPTKTRRSRRPDPALLLAAVAAVAAVVVAWQAIGDPWVKLHITDNTNDEVEAKVVGAITLQGHAAMVGVIVQAIVAAVGILAVVWLLYGIDRGWTMRWIVNPVIAIVLSMAALFGAGLSAMVWFVWEDAAVDHSRAVKMSADELKTLLDTRPAPLVEIQRMSGMLRFGVAMTIALAAACVAWWAYRKRD